MAVASWGEPIHLAARPRSGRLFLSPVLSWAVLTMVRLTCEEARVVARPTSAPPSLVVLDLMSAVVQVWRVGAP